MKTRIRKEAVAIILGLWLIFPIYGMVIPSYACAYITDRNPSDCLVDFGVAIGFYKRIEK